MRDLYESPPPKGVAHHVREPAGYCLAEALQARQFGGNGENILMSWAIPGEVFGLFTSLFPFQGLTPANLHNIFLVGWLRMQPVNSPPGIDLFM